MIEFRLAAGSNVPPYLQLVEQVRQALRMGLLQAGDQLPTVRQLAVELSINANTVARVYAELERTGILETRRGVGTFVIATPAKAHPPKQHERRLRSFITRLLADASAAGFTLDDLLEALQAHRKEDE